MIAELFSIPAAGLAAAAILDRDSRRKGAWMALALGLGVALLLGDQWDSAQITDLRNSPATIAALLLAAAVVTIGLAWAFRARPVLFPAAVVIALPFRIPLEVGGETANLLVPLYLVIASGTAAWLWGLLRDRPRTPATGHETGLAAWVRPLLALSVVLYAVTLLYSEDASRGIQNLCFFLLPFSVLFALLLEVRWSARTLRIVFAVLVAQAVLCALVGLGQFLTRELFWNETVIRSNDFHVYFRVNSLFWDPNIFGRYLALVIAVVASVMAWSRRRADVLVLAGVALLLWLALAATFSQSSFLALLAALAALVALRWSLRGVLAGAGVLLVAGLLFLTLAGGVIKLNLDRINPQTGGRADLVTGGIELFGNRPLTGYGAGSFSVAFRDEVAGSNAPVTESHTEPVTVAAETGIVGLAVYLALLIASFGLLLTGARSTMPGLGRASETDLDPVRGPPAARAAIFAAFIGLLVHTISYAGFLDDPVTWALLAVGLGLAFPCRDTSGD